MALPSTFDCAFCESPLHDDGTCGVCAANATAEALLLKGCDWCGERHLSDADMEPGWFGHWMADRAEQGREPAVICAGCWDTVNLLPAAWQNKLIRMAQGVA